MLNEGILENASYLCLGEIKLKVIISGFQFLVLHFSPCSYFLHGLLGLLL